MTEAGDRRAGELAARAFAVARQGEIPAEAAAQSLLNVLGTAIGGSGHAGSAALRARPGRGGTGEVAVPGLAAPLPVLLAAEVTGFQAHVEDFDDTDLATVLHPAAAVMAAALAAGQQANSSGHDLLVAFAVGCEVQMRIARSISPSHYDRGWHITGTWGGVGGELAAGLLTGLDVSQLTTAAGIAAFFSLGHREAFGSHVKAFHPGKAAASGLLAARMAAAGTGSGLGLGAALAAFAGAMADNLDDTALWSGLGDTWVLEENSFKPYPCGIVSHPCIDAAVELHATKPEWVSDASFDVRCHPLVPELTGNMAPADGLQAKFSTAHGVAVGAIFGRAGVREYSDDIVRDPAVAALRRRVILTQDATMPRDAARLVVTRPAGDRAEIVVQHARGSLHRPLTGTELFEKVSALVEPVLGEDASRLAAAVNGLPQVPALKELMSVACPQVAR